MLIFMYRWRAFVVHNWRQKLERIGLHIGTGGTRSIGNYHYYNLILRIFYDNFFPTTCAFIRSRSRSPNEKKWLPTELKQHLEFSLVDTTGMTEEQLKEIPYTVVQTSHARQAKLKTSSKHRQYVKVICVKRGH